MESRHVGASSKGVLIPVSETSDVFQSSVLAPLQSAYLYEESKQFFRYKSAVLVKNPHLEEKYNAFRAKRINAGYSEDDLKESYGFLLFEDGSKANALGETGVLTGNSTCTTLGDPSKGVYIPMYSDCLDLNPWYHGKTGYIVIIRLTKGKVKKVVENYTQNFTEPTVGFDCHVSEQLPSVSAKTSSFLAFERTQYYIYELLDDGSRESALSPSAAFPYAVVSFSYKDTNATLLPQETSAANELVCHYLLWSGQLQMGSQFYHVDLRSPAVALVPVKLPPVVKVDKVIPMSVLRQLLPRAVFETCCAEEAFYDGFYCSLCEFVPSEAEEGSSFAQLLAEIKEKDLALVFHLNDRGFLILLHPSQFLTYEDNDSTSSEVMPGLFVFPDSRAVRRDTKVGQKNLGMSLDILRLLPVLSFAEGEVEKTPMDPSRDFCEVLAQHMESYATLINPGLSARPTRELSIFPDQYDVGEVHKHLYSSPEWTNGTWQNFVSSLGKPESFQLPVLKVSEILAAGQEERREDLDEDDVYICLSSPEAPTSPVGLDLEDQLSEQQPPVTIESSVDMSVPESQVAATCEPHSVVTDDLQAGDDTKDNQKTCDLTELNKTDEVETKSVLSSPTSDDLPAELIVSITSAEKSDENLSNISAMATEKHNDFQFSGISPISKLQKTEVNSVRHKTDKVKKILNSSEVAKLIGEKQRLTGEQQRQLRRRPSQVQKKVSKASIETRSLQVVSPSGQVHLNYKTDEHAKDLDVPQFRNSLKTSWRKLHRRKRRFGKLSPKCKKVRSGVVGSAIVEIKKPDEVQQSLESTTLMEDFPLRKKTERWDLKPVLSECGRILVPFGFLDITDVVRSSKVLLQSTEKECLEPVVLDVPKDSPDTAEMEEESSATSGKVEADVMATNSLEDGDDLNNNAHVSPEQNVLKPPVGENGSVPLSPDLNNHSSKNDDTETVLLHAVEDNQIETLSPVKPLAKGEFLLSRLKSVLSRRKRKVDLEKKETESTHQDDEPHLKKANVDSDTETSKSKEPAPPITDSSVNQVSNIRSVDLAFAYCLGLTPKEKIQNTEDQDDQRKDSTENEEHISLDKQPQIMQRPPSIFQRRKRIKTLKRLQGISAENVKKKWWLHFQTPACYTSEKVTHTRDYTVKKTVKEKMKSACSSTDALNLLADLALRVSNDQIPPHPYQALDMNPKESLKTCELSKALSRPNQESILHALLKNSSAKAIQPFECASPSPTVGDRELVGLISKEHDYSLLPSSSLLLDLPGATFQVPPLSGSTGLLNHHQSVHDDGIKTLQPSVNQEDTCEHNQASDRLNRHRQKFRHSRTFAFKDGSVQVTRQWQENYDFSLDSRFTSDPKDKVIIRALHGPWDFSIQDTTEEVRLIFHMWIGLFYSRSTSRFFQIDPNFTHQFEESESLQKASKRVSGPARTEHGTNSSAALSSVTSTPDPLVSEALDLSKKEGTVLEPESVVLDLSQRSSIVSSELQVNRESSEQGEHVEPLEHLTSAAEPQEEVTSKHCEKMETEFVKEGNVLRNISESNKTETLQKTLCLGLNEVPSSKVDKTHFSQPEEMCVSVEPEAVSAALENGRVLNGYNEVTTVMKDSTENSEASNKSLDQNHEIDSQNSVTVKVNSNLEKSDLVNTDDHDKVKESCNTRNDPCSESNIDPDVMETDDNTANKKSDVICKEDLLNQKLLSSKETKAISPDHNGDLNGDDGCTKLEEFQDDCLRNDELDDDEETCISSVEVDRDVEHRPSPEKTDGQIKEGCILESIDQEQPHEQPLSENSKNDCNDLCASPIPLKDGSPTLNSCYTPTEITPISKNSAAEEKFETIDINCQKPVLPLPDEDTCTLDKSPTAPCIPSEKDNIEMENRPKVLNFVSNFCSNDHKRETKPTEREENTGQTSPQEPCQQPSSSSESDVNMCEPDTLFPGKTDLKANETNKDGDKSWIRTVIPFLGEDTPDTHVLQPQDKVEKAVQDQETIPFINVTTDPVDKLPRDECSASHSCDEMEELSSRSMPLLVASETPKLEVFDRISGSRSPTPTMDEKTYENISSSPISSTFTNSDDETCQNITPNGSSRCSSPVMNELPFEQKLKTSTVNDSYPVAGLHSDVKLRTLRVLQSINKYFSTGCDIDMPSQIKTDEIKTSPDPADTSGNKLPLTHLELSHISSDVTNQRSTNEKPPEMSSSNLQDLCSKSTDNTLGSSLKNKSEEVHNVKLHQKNKKSSVSQQKFKRSNRQKTSVESNCRSYRCFSSAEGLRHKHKRTLQSNLNHKSRSHAQHSVVAAKRFRSEESPTHWLSKDTRGETTSQSKQVDTLIIDNSSSTSMLSKKRTRDFLKGTSEGLNINHIAHKPSGNTSWLTNASYSKYNVDEENSVHFDPPHLYREKTLSELTSSPLSMSSFKATESYPEFVDEHQGFLRYSLNKTTENPAEQRNQKDFSDKSFMHHKDNGFCKGRHKDEGSIICTIFNTGQKDSYSVLDQLSQRCLPGDPTQASVERERLIFSEQMRNLLKKSKGGPIGQQNTCDSFTQSCTSPLIVNFSSLEEQEDSLKVLNMPLVRQKIMVDMSDRKGLANSTRGEKMPRFLSQGTRNPVDPARVSGLIAEGARMYEAKMDGICLVKKASSRTKRIHRGYSGTEPSNHFDFCNQMKKELDKTFRSSLNAVVKKSSKAKYRFYLLVTSDDVFFKETKAHLEAEGHTAVQLSEFSPGEDSSSCLLIILRNQDIAEHICKIPHLLKLKMTPGVQFAGIDEPDDVVNLTHQELFTRAGFIIIDRAVLEPLSLCHMKKISEILQELNRKRKWKWMLHYRDSRRLKENARLSEVANEKKLFLNWGQDAGILEVLPYHECDLMSKGHPDYLACLLRLQVQHISSRYPVFITDAATNGAFEENGILTMTLNSFLTKPLPEIFAV